MSSGNGEVVAGTGEQCPPFDEARCGDGRKATEAQLLGPKGAYTNKHKKTQESYRWVVIIVLVCSITIVTEEDSQDIVQTRTQGHKVGSVHSLPIQILAFINHKFQSWKLALTGPHTY